MPATTFPTSSVTLRPPLQRAFDGLRLAVRATVSAIALAWHARAARRHAWQRREALAHLHEHLLKDIGADDEMLAGASARRTREDLRSIEMRHGIGRYC